ncbi:glutamine synthetase [Striga asiatica]|uniref:Glutamine synthetase n=1 Tax=Striga asiatica TaxID=4170 RepID=A0A5A7PC96_STRAF|nr:glutamine synthetase [Striga asiatica]
MAQILAPSAQWQMRISKNSMDSSPLTNKVGSSVVLKQTKKGAVKSSAKFRVLAVKSENSTINRLEQMLNLDVTPYTDKIIAEYIWIGGSGIDVRSKSRTISKHVEHPSELPKWNYDGSSTGQAPGEDSEVILYSGFAAHKQFSRTRSVVAITSCVLSRFFICVPLPFCYTLRFHHGNLVLGAFVPWVICDTYTPAGEPIPTNKRYRAAQVFSDPKVAAEIPWYGIEQEYTLLQTNVKWPLGWPTGGYPGPQGPYYCGAGADKSFGRDISDAHYKACLYAGINISGTNGEVMPGQWEYQVGPSVGIEAGDHIWCSRYLLERITEQAGVVLSLDPKPIEGDWNGAGCHTNYSTKSMREEGGFEVIKKAILNLSLRHKEHISAYGEGNERRLTGKHETASIHKFSWGVANRGCSIRVGRDTEKTGKGYLEDRRPASNMDPYVVTSLLAETTILWEPTLEAEALAAQKLSLNV